MIAKKVTAVGAIGVETRESFPTSSSGNSKFCNGTACQMDEGRVAHLLEGLRQRSPEDLTVGVLALAGSLTPEMWRALALFRMEQRGEVTEGRTAATARTGAVPRNGNKA